MNVIKKVGPAATVAMLLSLPAAATTSLTYFWSDIECGVGSVLSSCDRPSFTALLQPGQTVFVEATLNWTYRDDGLPLDPPGRFQLDTMGLRNLFATYEAAGLYLISNQCRDARGNCPIRTEFSDAFNGPNYLIFGNDPQPDSFSGQATYRASRTLIGNWPGSAEASAFMGVYFSLEYSSNVPAVPEPSSYMLLASGLLGLAWFARRRAA